MRAKDWIQGITPHVVIAGLLASAAVMIPGYLTLLVHKPLLVAQLDPPKLMLVCSGVTLPMLLTHLQRSGASCAPGQNPMAARAIWVALIRTWAILLTALLISFSCSTAFETHVMITAAIQALVWGMTRGRRDGGSSHSGR